MNEKKIIQKTIDFVKEKLEKVGSSHDFWHIDRAYKIAEKIWKSENCNMLVVRLAILLHDIADYKYNKWSDEVWDTLIKNFLESIWVDDYIINEVRNIVKYISFSTNLGLDIPYESIELDIVKDADKLDAIWAIWIARTFAFWWEFNREIYNPEIKPKLDMTKEQYRKNKSTSINHFYEKLLNLKDILKTKTWKKIWKRRHRFIELYLEEFMWEWEGKF